MKFKALILMSVLSLILCKGILGGDDHDKVAYQIINLTVKLNEKNTEQLRAYAYNVDNYLTDGRKIFGGIHDYIRSYDKPALIKYLINSCLSHRELLKIEKFENVVNNRIEKLLLQNENIEKAQSNSGFLKVEDDPIKVEGLHDHIYRQHRNTLIKWALTCELFDRKAKNRDLIIGGLNDYIDAYTDKQIADYILNIVDIYPELNSKEKLEDLAVEYEIKYYDKNNADPNNEDNRNIIEGSVKNEEEEGGLVDFIWRLPRETLYKYALSVERYDHEMQGMIIKGGIIDIIDDLNTNEICNFIQSIVKKHKELNNKSLLDSIVRKYGYEL